MHTLSLSVQHEVKMLGRKLGKSLRRETGVEETCECCMFEAMDWMQFSQQMILGGRVGPWVLHYLEQARDTSAVETEQTVYQLSPSHLLIYLHLLQHPQLLLWEPCLCSAKPTTSLTHGTYSLELQDTVANCLFSVLQFQLHFYLKLFHRTQMAFFKRNSKSKPICPLHGLLLALSIKLPKQLA